jgi:hypothetical protein
MYAQSAALLPDEGLPALRVFQDAIRAALRSSWIREHALLTGRIRENTSAIHNT